jgi:hypothetical protein
MDLSRFLYRQSEAAPESLRHRTPSPFTLLSMPSSSLLSSHSSSSVLSTISPPGLDELYVTPGSLELPLNLLIVGHNPSHESWTKGHYYANPSNRMWSLLRKAQLVPSNYLCSSDSLCPLNCRIGFTDLLIKVPETDSSKLSKSQLFQERFSFYERVIGHCRRVRANLLLGEAKEGKEKEGEGQREEGKGQREGQRQEETVKVVKDVIEDDTETEETEETEAVKEKKEKEKGEVVVEKEEEEMEQKERQKDTKSSLSPGLHLPEALIDSPQLSVSYSPTIIAFAGIRQWKCLFPFSSHEHKKDYRTCYGIQTVYPPDWPKELSSSLIYLLPSTSGAAPMTVSEREDPYLALGSLIRSLNTSSVQETRRISMKRFREESLERLEEGQDDDVDPSKE